MHPHPSSECGRSMNDWMRLRVWGCFSHSPSVRSSNLPSRILSVRLPALSAVDLFSQVIHSHALGARAGRAKICGGRRGGRACAGVAGRRQSQKASNLNQQTREEECGGRERRFNFCGSIGKRRLDNDNGEQVIRWHKIPLLLSLFSESTTEYKYAVLKTFHS